MRRESLHNYGICLHVEGRAQEIVDSIFQDRLCKRWDHWRQVFFKQHQW
jgi:hypothetical protein